MQMRQHELLILQRIRISSATRLERANRKYGLRGRAPKSIHHNVFKIGFSYGGKCCKMLKSKFYFKN